MIREASVSLDYRLTIKAVIIKGSPSLWFFLLSLVSLILGACGDTPERTYRGFVVDVQESAPFVLKSIKLQSEDGEVRQFLFTDKLYDGFTPSHLREHMLLGDPVSVRYRDNDGILVIVSIKD